MKTFFDDHNSITDEQLEFVIDWIAANRSNAPPLYLAPDFMLPPSLLGGHSEQDMRAFVERCRRLFVPTQIISVMNFFGPPVPKSKIILVTHHAWEFCEELIDPHCRVVQIDRDDTLQTILRQLIVYKLAHYLYRADYTRMEWLFKPMRRNSFSVMNMLHSDFEFDGAINSVLLDWDEDPLMIAMANECKDEVEANANAQITF